MARFRDLKAGDKIYEIYAYLGDVVVTELAGPFVQSESGEWRAPIVEHKPLSSFHKCAVIAKSSINKTMQKTYSIYSTREECEQEVEKRRKEIIKRYDLDIKRVEEELKKLKTQRDNIVNRNFF